MGWWMMLWIWHPYTERPAYVQVEVPSERACIVAVRDSTLILKQEYRVFRGQDRGDFMQWMCVRRRNYEETSN